MSEDELTRDELLARIAELEARLRSDRDQVRANLRIARLVEQRAQDEAELRAVKAALQRCVQVLSDIVAADVVGKARTAEEEPENE